MIPPLEDEIDEEEEEMMEEGMAPMEDSKPQNPAGKGIPPVDDDLAPLEEAAAPVEEEKSGTAETGRESSEQDVNKKVAAAEEGTSPAEHVIHDEKTPEKEMKDCPAELSETKDEVDPSSPKELKPMESEEEEAAPSDASKEEKG